MRAAITGATGFIGGHLKNYLLSQNVEVETISRGAKLAELCNLFERFRPNVVFHLASLFIAEHKPDDVDGLITSNVLFGTQVVEAMKCSGVKRLINTSTSWQNYQDRPGVPVCLYAATKTAFEEILRYYSDAEGLKVISLEIFDTYGPADSRPKLIPKLLQAFGSQNPIDLSAGEQSMDFVHISDVVQAYAHAGKMVMEDASNGGYLKKYSISSGRQVSLKGLITMLEEMKGQKLPIRWGARPYRRREVMTPWANGTVLPDWKAGIGFQTGLRELIDG